MKLIVTQSTFHLLLYCLIIVNNLSFSHNLEPIDINHENCAILPGSIHVIKEELDVAGNLIRSCEGDFLINKCEGTCVSSLQPSVVHPSGFLKKCNCCRESRMKSRSIQLTNCFDPDGKKLTNEKGSMKIDMEEPESCHCLKCSN
ncbi:partner of bursicon-like [Panonychus citri]|uniref:partner of bursicon-like n=1 Tax=Panonychus citri TaxID=50023 RepID=UPI0023081C69|nr:partner of bursicon-like [Panonychus citri]